MEWGQPWGSEWGAVTPGSDFLDYFVQLGTHTLLTAWNDSWADESLLFESWSLTTTTGSSPIIAYVDYYVDGDDTKLLLTTDQELEPGVTYTMTTTAMPVGETVVPDPIVFEAKPIENHDSTVADGLVDIDADPFGEYKLTAGGDHAMKGGYATYRKLIIDRVLTRRYTLPFAPEYGSLLQHKRPKPDLRSEEKKLARELMNIPTTTSAKVIMTFENRHLIISVDCRSTLGVVREEVTV